MSGPPQGLERISIAQNLAELAATQPDRNALTDINRTISWRELHRRTNQIARGLTKAGVKFGDLVTIGMPNSVDFIEGCYGLWKIGATPQPISFRLPNHEALAVMDLAETPILISNGSVEGNKPRFDVETLYQMGEDDSDLPDVTAPIYKAPTSGGSTGRPKLILSGGPGVTFKGALRGGYRTENADVMIQPGPLYHNGPFTSCFGGLFLGAELIILPRFDAEEVLKAVDRHKGTWLYLVPTMMSRIWKLPDEVKNKYDISSLKTVWHLAAPCPPWLKEAFIHWMGPDTIMELYAGTEGQAVTIITGAEWLEHRGSVGRVAIGEMTAFDANGHGLPPGEIGEIYMRRPEGAEATYQYRGATARTMEGGWESLGDIGYFDADGYLYLADRRTDMILVGGSNVYPAEIEAALDEHPLVQSSAVIGLPDDEMGNIVHAIVQPKGDVTEDDLRSYVRGMLVTYKQPRTYEFVSENIRDDAGKVRRTQLRDERIAAMKSDA